MEDNTQQEKVAPNEAAARKPSLTLPWLMMLLPIPAFFVISLVITFSSVSDHYPDVSLADNSKITLHSHDTITIEVMGDPACIVTGPKGYNATVQHKPGTPWDQNLTFVTGARGNYRINCGDGSYPTVDDAQGDLGTEVAGRQVDEKNEIVAYTGLATMVAGLVILIQRILQRKKMSQAEVKAQATD